MARKVASFADKVAKDARKVVDRCPKCGAQIQIVKQVVSRKVEDIWKFNTRMVKVCKCNEREVYAL
jgi:predicted RNA-binding Zn-ribbon protein involved in translation (DUF1610 family)